MATNTLHIAGGARPQRDSYGSTRLEPVAERHPATGDVPPPSQRLLGSLNMSQVQHSMLEKQKAAHALTQQGLLPLNRSHETAAYSSRPAQQQPLGDEASRLGCRPGQQVGGTFSGMMEDQPDLQDSSAANPMPTEERFGSLGRCAPEETALALQLGRKSLQLREQPQVSGQPPKEKTRLEVIFDEKMTSARGNSLSPLAAKPAYTTSHLSGKPLAELAIRRAQNGVEEEPKISPDAQNAIIMQEGCDGSSSAACHPDEGNIVASAAIADKLQSDSRVALGISSKAFAKSQLWANGRGPDMAALKRASFHQHHQPMGRVGRLHQVEVDSNLASTAKLRLDRLEKGLAAAESKASRKEEQRIPEGFVAVSRSWDADMYSGAFGRTQDLQQKRQQEYKELIRCNPIAFQEDVASQADERYMATAEQARLMYDVAEMTVMAPHAVDGLKMAIKQLQFERPYFFPPVYEKDRVKRAQFSMDKKEKEGKRKPWALQASVFADRKKENESRSVFDSDQVRAKQFNLDWQRVMAKARFGTLLNHADQDVKANGQSVEEELSQVAAEVAKHKDQLRSIFSYYSVCSGQFRSELLLAIGLKQWMNFCHEAGILDNSTQGCQVTDLHNIFVAVNYEEESNTSEASENADAAMMRFEFYEAIVRSSMGKFIASSLMSDASDATQTFIAEVVLKNVPPVALLDPNDFRRTRFYTEEMDALVQSHWDLLLAMFKFYKAKDRTAYFWIENWGSLLEATRLTELAELPRRDMKIIFVWSQMLVTDELKRRKRAVGLMFFDFVEALARLADFISPPSMEYLLGGVSLISSGREMTQEDGRGSVSSPSLDRTMGAAAVRDSAITPGLNHPLEDYLKSKGVRPTSGGLAGAISRPLHEKFETLMDYLVHHHRAAWGGKNERECAAKMMRQCIMLGGGIELG